MKGFFDQFIMNKLTLLENFLLSETSLSNIAETFVGTLKGDSLEDNLITSLLPLINDSPGMYFAIWLIVGLTIFETIFFCIIAYYQINLFWLLIQHSYDFFLNQNKKMKKKKKIKKKINKKKKKKTNEKKNLENFENLNLNLWPLN